VCWGGFMGMMEGCVGFCGGLELIFGGENMVVGFGVSDLQNRICWSNNLILFSESLFR
jgi:hypothetical protein